MVLALPDRYPGGLSEHDLLELVSALVCLIEDGKITFINEAGLRMLDLDDAAQAVGRPFQSFIAEDYRLLVEAGWSLLADEDFIPLKLTKSHSAPFNAELRVRPLGEGLSGEGSERFLVEVHDISKFVKSAEALREREERLRGILHSVAEGIVTVGESDLIESANPAAERMFGYGPGKMAGHRFIELLDGDPREDSKSTLSAYLAARSLATSGHVTEGTGRRRDGHSFAIEVSVSELRQNRQRLFTAILRDISERKENEERVRRLAHHDQLTGLPNRNLLNDRMNHAIARVRRHGGRMAVLYIDLDRFKPVNDTLGHEAGDLVLQTVARRLLSCVRTSDTVARIGGDEFVVVTEEIHLPQDASLVAAKIIEALAEPIPVHDTICSIGASVGIAVFPDDGYSMDEVCKAADTAMYRVKHSGRNAWAFFGAGSGQI